MIDLVPGTEVPLPGLVFSVCLHGSFELLALVLGANGRLAGVGDVVSAAGPGLQVRPGRLTVTPGGLRPGAEHVLVVATPARRGSRFTAPPAATVVGPTGGPFARIPAPAPVHEPAVLLAQVRRTDRGWRLRGLGDAADLAGIVRDLGSDPVPPQEAEQGAVDAVNAERVRHGLPALTVHPRLLLAARAHSADMIARGFFDHLDPDGGTVGDRVLALGYEFAWVAENIAAGQVTAAEVTAAWMDSPGHRANILDADLLETGVGRVEGGGLGVYWTQVFGTGRGRPPAVAQMSS